MHDREDESDRRGPVDPGQRNGVERAGGAAPARTVERCFPRRIPRDAPLAAAPVPDAPRAPCAPAAVLRGLSDRWARGIAGALPAMVCGEESAVIVFDNERRRAPEGLFEGSLAMLARIAAEEEGHEALLRSIAERLPAPVQEASVRRMARRYFASLRSDDVGTHFSRIAWLDSGVCIILDAIVRSSLRSHAAPALRSALRSIVVDEARHVSFARAYAGRLGVSVADDHESFHRVRGGLVSLLEPCGGAFEDLEVDVHELFERLKKRGRLQERA